MHDRQATLYGEASTVRLLGEGRLSLRHSVRECGEHSALDDYIDEIRCGLHHIGLKLVQFCVVDDEAEGSDGWKETSKFAIVR